MAKNSILKTYDYARFIPSKFNREVKNTKKLEALMRKHGFIPAYAIHVTDEPDGRLRIKEGHHRFQIAMKLRLPIYYLKCNYQAGIQEMAESVRPWDLEDYLFSWARLDNEAYLAVRKYWEETGIPLNHCIGMLGGVSAGSDSFREAFKKGRYRLGDPMHADIVKNLVLHCRKLGVKWASHYRFVQALSRVAQAEGFNLTVMKKRMKANRYLMEKQPTTLKGFLDLLDNVYNYHSREKIPLAFNAEKAARERSAVQRHQPPEPASQKSRNAGGSVVPMPAAKARRSKQSTIGTNFESF